MCQYHGRVLSCEEIYEVLRCAKCTRLAVCGSGHPYIVPMNYTWDCVNGRLHFFLTSCGCGEKVRCLRKNNKVALEFEVAGENGCMCTVVAKGTVDEKVLLALRTKADLAKTLVDDYRSGRNPFVQ